MVDAQVPIHLRAKSCPSFLQTISIFNMHPLQCSMLWFAVVLTVSFPASGIPIKPEIVADAPYKPWFVFQLFLVRCLVPLSTVRDGCAGREIGASPLHSYDPSFEIHSSKADIPGVSLADSDLKSSVLSRREATPMLYGKAAGTSQSAPKSRISPLSRFFLKLACIFGVVFLGKWFDGCVIRSCRRPRANA